LDALSIYESECQKQVRVELTKTSG
jgi:hypothetical protein